MKFRIIFIFLFFITMTVPGFAEDITMEGFLDLVKANHPFFTKEALSADIERKQAESYLGAEDWYFSISPSFSRLGEASSSFDYGPGIERIYLFGTEAGIGRSIWKTGGSLGFSASTGYKNSDTTQGITKSYKHGVGISYTHPLMQNSKGKLDRLAYELSDYTIEFTEVRAAENQEDFLLGVAVRYLDWVELSAMIGISKERLALSQEQLQQVDKRFKANLVDRVDVLRGEDAVRIAEQTILQLELQWKATRAELSVLAGSDELYEKSPSYDIYALAELPAEDEASGRLKEQSRLLKTFDILKSQLAGQREGLLEQKRSQLSLGVAGGVYGSDEKFGKSLEIYKPDASVSLVFSKTFGNNTLNAQIEKIDLQVRQIEEDKKSVEVSLEASLINLLIQLSEMEKVLALNRAQIESAEEKTKEELKMYNQGRGQLTFVIQSRDNEENAKMTYADNSALYHMLLLQYRALLDELLSSE
jgi:outer membrane protein TolC